MPTTEERFWMRVAKSDGCWLWTGGKTSRGYGVISIDGKPTYVHRYVLQLAGRPLTSEQLACHHCDTPLCVRPDHLFAGTAADNASDMVAKGRSDRRPKSPETRARMSTAFRRRFQERPETHHEAARTHCDNGHEYTPENTAIYSGHRKCRTCYRAENRRAYWRRKAA